MDWSVWVVFFGLGFSLGIMVALVLWGPRLTEFTIVRVLLAGSSAGGWLASRSKEPPPSWHLDAAVPEEVRVGRAFDLAVAVRPRGAPLLQVDELTRVRSAAAQIEWPAEAAAVTLRAVVHAPDCDVLGQPFQMFRLHRDQPSPVVFFALRPRRAGELLIRVSLYQMFLALGSARLTAVAVEREAGGVVARVSSGLPLLGDDGQIRNAFQFDGIYSFLQRAFSLDELHSLSDELGVDWDALPGTTKQRQASELVSYCHRRGKLDELIERVMAARPDWLEHLEER